MQSILFAIEDIIEQVDDTAQQTEAEHSPRATRKIRYFEEML